MGQVISWFFGFDVTIDEQTKRERLTVYHGTSRAAADSIQASGYFHPSSHPGLFGRTTYFSENIDKAKQFGPVIFTCTVDKRACEIHQERGNICCVDDWRYANGDIRKRENARHCSVYDQCRYTECRECRTRSERKQEHRQKREDWVRTWTATIPQIRHRKERFAREKCARNVFYFIGNRVFSIINEVWYSRSRNLRNRGSPGLHRTRIRNDAQGRGRKRAWGMAGVRRTASFATSAG
jgi:hypothetical protein